MRLSAIRRKASLLLVGTLAWTATALAGEAVLLDVKSPWRCRIINGSIPLRNGSGRLEYAFESQPWKWSKSGGKRHKELRKTTRIRFRPAPPSADWVKPDFDDGTWGQLRGPFSGPRINYDYRSPYTLSYRTRLIYLRGKFIAKEPSRVGEMDISLTFLGGVVAYLNGTEIGRAHLPKGRLTHETFAEDYPLEAYVCPKGKTLYKQNKKFPDRFKLRLRELKVKIPASALREGTNVLALEIRCAPANEAMFLSKGVRNNDKHAWSRVGLEALKLMAAPSSTGIPNPPHTGRLKGFQVWNHSIIRRLYVSSYGNPAEPLRPIEIVGVKGGVFSGQVVVGSDHPIKGLKAAVGDLKGHAGALIPASAAEIRYPLPDGPQRGKGKTPYFDSLEEFPPAEVPVFQKTDRGGKAVGAPWVVQPVWVTVRVPKDAEPGDYLGKLTLSAQEMDPVEVPIKLKVVGWTLPDSKDFTYHTGLVQSPDSVARRYKVEMWSKEHWALVEKSLDLVGQLGGKVLYIPLIAETHFGNKHSMVRWIQEEDGEYSHDFSIVKKYVDLVVKHQGKLPVVCLYCWEPAKVHGHFDHGKFLGEREIRFSILDPQTGNLEVRKGPQWGTSECRRFFKPVFKGVMKILKKRGLAGSAMVGICNDFAPSPDATKTITAVAPKAAKWVVHSHGRWVKVRDRAVGYAAFVWGGPKDPANEPTYGNETRFYGWRSTGHRSVKFSRGTIRMWTPQAGYRIYPGIWLLEKGTYNGAKWPHGSKFSGSIGFGREGADFWNIPWRRGRSYSLAGFYSPWGGLDIKEFGLTYVLGPGKNGAVPTIRFEMLRESIQECEARISIERVLLDPDARAKLGEERADRLQEVLDEHARAAIAAFPCNARWLASSDWQKRSETLYSAAGETARIVATE